MNLEQKGNTRIAPLFSYAILIILVVLCLKEGLFGDFLVGFIVVGTLLIIRDITPFLGSFKNIRHRIFDWRAFSLAWKSGSIGTMNTLLIINRVVIFPLFLTLYITLILLKQLDIWSLATLLTETPWIEYGALAGVVISGCMTVIREAIDEAYYRYEVSQIRTRGFIGLTLMFTIGAIVIIFQETASLGLLSIPLSTISGLLVYLIGTLILDESENPS